MPERDPGGRHALRLLRSAPEPLAEEARAIAGEAPAAVEPLLHGHRFATGEVWRVRWARTSAVVKVIAAGPGSALAPSHFRWSGREAELLVSGLPPQYSEAGIRPPRLLRSVERSDGDVALWMEDVAATHGFEWAPEQYVEAARRLGRAQRPPPAPAQAWWSRGFLAAYLEGWDSDLDWALLESDEAWDAPLIRACWSPEFRLRLRRFHSLRPRLLGILDALPKVFCHLDFWPANFFAAEDELVAADWAFAGQGVPGEDIGNLLPDAAFDLILPAGVVAELVEPVFEAYVEGWPGDPRPVRLGMLASSVKYGWLPVALLAGARADGHAAYGGNLPADSATLYRERGLALEMLFDWADAALPLAAELDLG